jgi:hypothetical protein
MYREHFSAAAIIFPLSTVKNLFPNFTLTWLLKTPFKKMQWMKYVNTLFRIHRKYFLNLLRAPKTLLFLLLNFCHKCWKIECKLWFEFTSPFTCIWLLSRLLVYKGFAQLLQVVSFCHQSSSYCPMFWFLSFLNLS